MAVSVTFGAPHFGFPVTLGRRPFVDNITGTEDGGGFSTNGPGVRRQGVNISNVFVDSLHLPMSWSSCAVCKRFLAFVWRHVVGNVISAVFCCLALGVRTTGGQGREGCPYQKCISHEVRGPGCEGRP